MSGKHRGPICGASNPQYAPTPGPCGFNDSADVTHPLCIPQTPTDLGRVLIADARKAPPAATMRDPHSRPSPLEEFTQNERNELFKAAAQCFKKATGHDPKDAGDQFALNKSNVTPEVSTTAWWNEFHRQFKGTDADLLRNSWKKLSGLALPQNTKNPRILMNPDFYSAARKGGKWNGKSALLHYRDTYLEEQSHLYLHFRGVPFEQDAKKPQFGSGSCHHEAIPMIREKYRKKFRGKYSAADSGPIVSGSVGIG